MSIKQSQFIACLFIFVSLLGRLITQNHQEQEVLLKLRVEENPDVPATLSINNTYVRSYFSLPQNGRFTPCITFFQYSFVCDDILVTRTMNIINVTEWGQAMIWWQSANTGMATTAQAVTRVRCQYKESCHTFAFSFPIYLPCRVQN